MVINPSAIDGSIVVVVRRECPVAHREKIVQGVRTVAEWPVLKGIFTDIGVKQVVMR